MTAYPGWTPAARAGVIPLRPLTFGEIFGRSFSALRQNPAVMLGFALGFQMLASVISIAIIGVVTYAGVSRLATLSPYSQEWQDIEAGNTLLLFLVSLAVGAFTAALSAIIQGVVAAQIAASVLGERPRLGQLWQRVRPAIGRLLLYTLTLSAGAAAILAPGAALLVAGVESRAAGLAVLAVLLLLAAIPVFVWIATKLLLVPSAYVIENASFAAGIRRSWRLTRGRFWRTFGIWILINVIVQFAANAISTPVMLLSMAATGAFSPTGPTTESALLSLVIGMFGAAAIGAVIGAIGFIVQGSAATFVYIDARMRLEGLDLRLMAQADRLASGAAITEDPWAYDPNRPVPQRSPMGVGIGYGYSGVPGYTGQPGYGWQPEYPGQSGYGVGAPSYPGQVPPPYQSAPPTWQPAPPFGASPAPGQPWPSDMPPPSTPPSSTPSSSTPPSSTPPSSTQWRAPGGDSA